MSDESNKEDSLQPSWAAHELFALGLTLVLAVSVVSRYGKESRPVSLTTERDEARAAREQHSRGRVARGGVRRHGRSLRMRLVDAARDGRRLARALGGQDDA